ncbi:MAG: DUF5060 domain-containing protein [Armatimonadota bacterium]
MRTLTWLLALGLLAQLPSVAGGQTDRRTARQWEPVEWRFLNASREGNPFDLVAEAEFRHEGGRHRISTELFYAGGDAWVLRFTGTEPGKWSFTTRSSDPDLDGKRGEVRVERNPGAAGFVTAFGNKWGRTGTGEAFVPQIVSYAAPVDYYQKPEKVEKDLETWFEGHGFNGLHTFVGMAWFDLHKGGSGYDDLPADPNPDPRTFEALELLITRAQRAGGMVHLWAWGDEQREMTPVRWGINGKVDRRLQRYLCARLGPLPGWSMGYGFDLQEWVKREELREWHRHMHEKLGWPHLLGARAPDMEQIYDGLDYSSYQQWRPTYDTYVEALEKRSPGKPVFMEDRFRVRVNVYPEKDYDLDMTRRGMWHSTMAGGAANIWAYLINAPKDGSSGLYPNREQLLTYSRFWKDRFLKEMARDNARTDGFCLDAPGKLRVFYKEDAEAVRMDLSGIKSPFRAVAVDTRAPYREIPLSDFKAAAGQQFRAPHRSDWAIAVSRR